MKRLAIILAAVVIAVLGALLVAPQFIPIELARVRITEQIEQWIGRDVAFTGEPVISFFPRPSVRLQNVVIDSGDGSGRPFLTVEELTGTVRLLPLIFGDVEVSSFELVRPTISLRVDDDGRSNWTFEGTVGERVAEANDPSMAEAAPADEVVLGRFRILEGTITYEEPGAELAMITEVALDITWPSTAQAATARGSLVWHGERVAISAMLGDPLELIAGRTSPGRFTVEGNPIRISFDGTVGRSDLDFSFSGTTDVAMPSLRGVILWAGADIAQAPTLAAAAISGRASWEWPILSFANAEMQLDGNEANGAFTVDFSGERIDIVGTLALDELDLTPYAYAFRDDLAAGGDWQNTAISLPLFDYVDADIRISADRVTIGATDLDSFAIAAIADDGAISLRLGETGFYGGRMQATFAATYREPLFAAEARVTLVGVDARPALVALVGVDTLTGRASGTLDVAAEGRSWGELVQRLTGTLAVAITNGSLVGVNLAPAAAEAAPTVAMVGIGSGETPFARFDARMSFLDGQLVADELAIAGPAYIIQFRGFGGLTQPAIGGQGTAVFSGAGMPERTLPFAVTGTWAEPMFADAAADLAPAPGAPL